MDSQKHRYSMDNQVNIDEMPKFVPLIGLALLCIVLFVTHLGINGEILAFGPHELTWGAGPGPVYILNGVQFHFEGLPNLRNTAFFAGADSMLDLGYTIPTGRLLAPFLAGLINLITHDVYTSMIALNLLCWIGGAWAAYGLGCCIFKSRWMGILMALLLATSMGFVSNPVDIKVHLISYAWFMIAIFLIHRLGFFKRETPLTNIVAASIVVAFGMYVNGTHLILLVYVFLIGLFQVSWLRLTFPLLISGFFTIVTKMVFTIAIWSNIHVGSMEKVVIGNFMQHLSQTLGWIIGKPVDFEISSSSGYYRYTDILGPFDYAISSLPSFFMIAGVPLIVLSLIGLLRPRMRELSTGFAMIFSGWLIVIMTCTYWPWRSFFGYMHYYSVAGYYVLGAMGAMNLAAWSGRAVQLCGASDLVQSRVMLGSMAIVFVSVLLYANQDILFGHLIEHVHFHRSVFVPYPWDWDFNVTSW